MVKKISKNIVTQIGILTKDIEKSKAAWEKFFRIPKQPISQSEGYGKTHALYHGEPLNGLIYQVCFDLGNIQLELIQPIGDTPSYWKECLDRDGEGIHHFSFAVKDMEGNIKDLEELGMTLTQKGEFTGGRYAYLDARNSLSIILELLEKDKEEI